MSSLRTLRTIHFLLIVLRLSTVILIVIGVASFIYNPIYEIYPLSVTLFILSASCIRIDSYLTGLRIRLLKINKTK